MTQIQPDNSLNVLGGDNLTIIGTNFPCSLVDNTIDIELDKDKLVECIHSEIDDAIDTDEDSIDDEVTAVLGEMYLESIS